VKPYSADNFSVTRYHISEPYVDREVDGEQVINSQVFVIHASIYLSLCCIQCISCSVF